MGLIRKGNRDDIRYNGEGYPDPTAAEAIAKADLDLFLEKQAEERFKKLLHTIKNLCELSGFELAERVVLRDEKTGKTWR